MLEQMVDALNGVYFLLPKKALTKNVQILLTAHLTIFRAVQRQYWALDFVQAGRSIQRQEVTHIWSAALRLYGLQVLGQFYRQALAIHDGRCSCFHIVEKTFQHLAITFHHLWRIACLL